MNKRIQASIYGEKRQKFNTSTTTFVAIIILSLFIMSITFLFSRAVVDLVFIKSYITDIVLMVMNFIPIFLFMSFIYLISNRLWVSFSLTSLLFVIMAIVNKFKLTFRDDPFSFVDVTLFTESLMMADKYKISLTPLMIIIFLLLIGIAILLKKFFNYKIESKDKRILTILVLILISITIFKGFYFNPKIYAEVGDKSIINIWVETDQLQSKGFIYPFIYNIPDAKDNVLEGYDKDKAIEELNKNTYKDIPQDKKVNIIAIMLEAYNDFSVFESMEVDETVYENFHKLQEESIQGHLITNVFAGGTIDTERGFLTGYHYHPKYNRRTNSHVWYLKEQGYRTEAMHPITGSFYNRRNVNEYIGFDEYYYYENKYKEIQEEYMDDTDFFDSIIEGYENSKKNNEPYFNFSVTYQNHGPYPLEEYTDTEYLKKHSSYDPSTYNIINNYLAGISRTDKALKELFDYYRNEEEPTVIVIFGDHNPWLGTDRVGYNMLGIDIDLGTSEGFTNYFQTPYLIWGNDGAKETFNKDFLGQGNTIGPNFLMAELFQYLGWEGNRYMQYITDLKETIDVTNGNFYKENGQYTKELENKELWKNYKNVEYYQSHNYNK